MMIADYGDAMTSETPSSGTSGHCLCGHVRYQFSGERTWACYCHCHDCRRNCAAPVVAFIGTRLDQFQWQTGGVNGLAPKFYASSKGVKRFFCDQCGTPMAFQAEHYDGEIHLYAPTLTNPEDFAPEFHVHHDSKLSWLALDDGLLCHGGSAPSDEKENP